jgi:hypothetical protein
MADYTLSAGGRLTTGIIPPPDCVPTIADSYFDPAYILDAAWESIEEGVSFLSSASGTLTKVSFWLSKVGTLTGNMKVNLYEHTGIYGSSSTPGALLATSDSIDVSTLPTSTAQIDFEFSGAFSLVAGTHYIATVHYVGADPTNYYTMAYMPVPPGSHPGCEVENLGVGGWDVDTLEDNLFSVEVCVPTATDEGGCWRLVTTHDPCGVRLEVKNASNVWEIVWTGRAST